MKWIGKHIVRTLADFSEDVTFYQPVNNADPQISLGSSDDERLKIGINYQGTTTQSAQIASFQTFTESGTAHDGRFHFLVDEVTILKIQDGGIDFFAGKGIGINGVDILTDNGSGTATLSNIDALDATTIATIESNIDTITNDLTISTTGTQLKLAHNANDYATLTVADTGDLTIATVGDGTTDSDLILDADGKVEFQPADGKTVNVKSTETSSSTTGGKLNLVSDDGAALGDDHLLGRLAFVAAEDSSGTVRTGAKIEAYADAAWSGIQNDTRLEFYTMDGNNNTELSLTLDSDLLATFAGAVTVTGALTGTLATVSQPNITGVGTIGTGTWQGTAVASAYLDADTAHLSGVQQFTGAKAFAEITSAIFDGDKNVTPGDGAVIHVDSHDITDTNTSASGTAAMYTHVNIEAPRLTATNSSVTTTAAATLRINNAPAAGTNQTITNAYALWVDDGLVKFDGALTVGGTITGDVTGALTGQAATVATIAGLAPNTATTQATQAAITTCANLATVGTVTTGVWEGTAIATDQQKHLASFRFAGYGTTDGTNYEIPEIMTDTNAPFEHNTSAGADGLTALAVSLLLRCAGQIMPYAGTLKKWVGWAASSGSGTTYVSLFRYRPNPSSSSAVSLVLLDEQSFTAAGNNTVVAISQTSFTDADVAAGDIIITGVKGINNKTVYFTSTLEVEWD